MSGYTRGDVVMWRGEPGIFLASCRGGTSIEVEGHKSLQVSLDELSPTRLHVEPSRLPAAPWEGWRRVVSVRNGVRADMRCVDCGREVVRGGHSRVVKLATARADYAFDTAPLAGLALAAATTLQPAAPALPVFDRAATVEALVRELHEFIGRWLDMRGSK